MQGGCILRSRSLHGVTGVVKEVVVGRVLLMSCAHRLLSLAFMESLTIYGLVIALVPAPAVLKATSSDCHRMIRTRARCLPRCSSSPTPSSSEQDVSGEVLQLRVGGASEEEEESVRSEKWLANRKGFVLLTDHQPVTSLVLGMPEVGASRFGVAPLVFESDHGHLRKLQLAEPGGGK